jgi:hypothetical protein
MIDRYKKGLWPVGLQVYAEMNAAWCLRNRRTVIYLEVGLPPAYEAPGAFPAKAVNERNHHEHPKLWPKA